MSNVWLLRAAITRLLIPGTERAAAEPAPAPLPPAQLAPSASAALLAGPMHNKHHQLQKVTELVFVSTFLFTLKVSSSQLIMRIPITS